MEDSMENLLANKLEDKSAERPVVEQPQADADSILKETLANFKNKPDSAKSDIPESKITFDKDGNPKVE